MLTVALRTTLGSLANSQQPLITNHQPPITNRQPPTTNHQPHHKLLLLTRHACWIRVGCVCGMHVRHV